MLCWLNIPYCWKSDVTAQIKKPALFLSSIFANLEETPRQTPQNHHTHTHNVSNSKQWITNIIATALERTAALGTGGLLKCFYAQNIGILHTQIASKCDQEISQLHSAHQPRVRKVPSHNNYQVTLNVYGGSGATRNDSECWMQSERYVIMIKKKTITHCRPTHATVRQSDRTLT